MRRLFSIILFVLLGSRAVAGLTYVVDAGCGSTMDPIIAETVQMATKALDKLGSGDEVMMAALELIFKTTDAAFLTNGLKTIQGVTSTTDFDQSDIRIYCDNDAWDDQPGGTNARWQLEPDKKVSKRLRGKVPLNSQKPFEEQVYWDPRNQLYKAVGRKGCQDVIDGEMSTFAQTYRVNPSAVIPSSQNPNRVAITICNVALNEAVKVLSDVPVEKDLTKNNLMMMDMSDLMSITLFHEFCHMGTTFNAPGSRGDEPHGWEEIVTLSADASKRAADAYAFLGLAAILSDRNARISTDPDKAKEGIIQWIKPPEAPKRKRGRPIWFSS